MQIPQPGPAVPLVIDGFPVPDNADDVQDWYLDAADAVAQLDGDDLDGARSRRAHRQLAAARQAMEGFGLTHGGPAARPTLVQTFKLADAERGAKWSVWTFSDGTATLNYVYADRTVVGQLGRRPAAARRAGIVELGLPLDGWPEAG